ncbi:N-acetylmuramoyl-L-alanine amidase, partial [Candidatus Marinimicrobia bacterium MT.SAG.2]
MALILRDLLREAGARVIMTRETNRDLNLGGRATIAKINNSDLFISIHHN